METKRKILLTEVQVTVFNKLIPFPHKKTSEGSGSYI